MTKPPRLADYEGERRLDGDAYEDTLADVQKRLAHIQGACIGRHTRAVIAVEGWDAAGKGGFIQRLTAPWDPRFYDVIPVRAPTPEEKAHHYLWRFWRDLPAIGEVNVFDRTWYGRVLVERVEAFATNAEWRRAYDEINAFEKTLTDDGMVFVKLFFHVTQAEQDRRLIERIEKPWKRWKVSEEDFRNRGKRKPYEAAIADMFERTHTRAAPWKIINGNDKHSARIEALEHVAERLTVGLDLSPPALTPKLRKLAGKTFGKKLNAF